MTRTFADTVFRNGRIYTSNRGQPWVACAAVKAGGYGRRELVIRTNGVGTAWFGDDLGAAVEANPDAILIPKVSTPETLKQIGARLDSLKAQPTLRVWAMIETPRGVLNAAAIGSTAPPG